MEKFEILLYSTPEGKATIEVFFEQETFWLSQKKMADLFRVDVRTINEHLKNIYATRELVEKATIRKFRIVQKEGNSGILKNAGTIKHEIAKKLAEEQYEQFRIEQDKLYESDFDKLATHLPPPKNQKKP